MDIEEMTIDIFKIAHLIEIQEKVDDPYNVFEEIPLNELYTIDEIDDLVHAKAEEKIQEEDITDDKDKTDIRSVYSRFSDILDELKDKYGVSHVKT